MTTTQQNQTDYYMLIIDETAILDYFNKEVNQDNEKQVMFINDLYQNERFYSVDRYNADSKLFNYHISLKNFDLSSNKEQAVEQAKAALIAYFKDKDNAKEMLDYFFNTKITNVSDKNEEQVDTNSSLNNRNLFDLVTNTEYVDGDYWQIDPNVRDRLLQRVRESANEDKKYANLKQSPLRVPRAIYTCLLEKKEKNKKSFWLPIDHFDQNSVWKYMCLDKDIWYNLLVELHKLYPDCGSFPLILKHRKPLNVKRYKVKKKQRRDYKDFPKHYKKQYYIPNKKKCIVVTDLQEYVYWFDKYYELLNLDYSKAQIDKWV